MHVCMYVCVCVYMYLSMYINKNVFEWYIKDINFYNVLYAAYYHNREFVKA